jgi:hypothetical protein
VTMKKKIIIALLVTLALTLSTRTPAYGQRKAHAPQAPTWQGGLEAAVRLTVRDKFGDFAGRSYVATFTVTAPDHRHYYSTVRVAGDDAGAAVFPGDFSGAETHGAIKPGRYTFTCAVEGAIIFRGAFAFQSSLTFDPIRQPKRKR